MVRSERCRLVTSCLLGVMFIAIVAVTAPHFHIDHSLMKASAHAFSTSDIAPATQVETLNTSTDAHPSEEAANQVTLLNTVDPPQTIPASSNSYWESLLKSYTQLFTDPRLTNLSQAIQNRDPSPEEVAAAWPCFANKLDPKSYVEGDPAQVPYVPRHFSLPYSQEAQLFIHRKQFLADCRDPHNQFMRWSFFDSGIGSDLHTTSWALAYALKHNRTLLLVDHWRYAASPGAFEEFFAPISNCNLNTIGSHENGRVFDIGGFGGMAAEFDSERNPRHIVPEPFPTVAFKPHWWRAQTAAFFLRRPACWIQSRITSELKQMFPATGTMPAHAINLHIRHGDKGGEMSLHPTSDYMAKAEAIRKEFPEATTIFVSTEDSTVIEDIKNPQYSHFKFVYTTFHPRENRNLGGRLEGEIAFVNLFLASMCEHYVGTLGSNWNRLIREMKDTHGHANREYYSLYDPKCDPLEKCDW